MAELIKNEPVTTGAPNLDEVLVTASSPHKPSILRDDYKVRIPMFEGPLDLLLHLIRREQIDIKDIPLALICERYLDHLNLMREMDIDIAGEFMVMASTLILMKSYTLLPVENPEQEEEIKRPLVERLLEYQRFKEAAEKLEKRDWLERELYLRPATAIQSLLTKEAMADAPIEPIDNYLLLVCLKTALDRTNRPPIEITAQHVSMKETVVGIKDSLTKDETIEFESLIQHIEPRRKVQAIVMRFMAMLELARMKFIEIIQTHSCGPIQIRRVRDLEELDLNLLEQY